MTEDAAIGESQTADAVAAENKLAAEAMINEGAPAPDFEGAAADVAAAAASGITTEHIEAQREKLAQTIHDAQTLEQFIRSYPDELITIKSAVNEAGDVYLFVFDAETGAPIKQFAIMGELAKNVTRLAA